MKTSNAQEFYDGINSGPYGEQCVYLDSTGTERVTPTHLRHYLRSGNNHPMKNKPSWVTVRTLLGVVVIMLYVDVAR